MGNESRHQRDDATLFHPPACHLFGCAVAYWAMSLPVVSRPAGDALRGVPADLGLSSVAEESAIAEGDEEEGAPARV